MPAVIDQVRTALDDLASALVSGRPDAVLAAEAPLAAAASALNAADPRVLAADPATRQALLDVRLSMARCQLLGRSAADLHRVISPQAAYGPAGKRPAMSTRTSTVTSVT